MSQDLANGANGEMCCEYVNRRTNWHGEDSLKPSQRTDLPPDCSASRTEIISSNRGDVIFVSRSKAVPKHAAIFNLVILCVTDRQSAMNGATLLPSVSGSMKHTTASSCPIASRRTHD